MGSPDTPLAVLTDTDLPDGWTISTALETHTTLYHRPTGRAVATFPTPTTTDGWTVMGTGNYDNSPVYARGVDANDAASLVFGQAEAGTDGDWLEDPDTIEDAPPPAPVRSGGADEATDETDSDDDQTAADAEPAGQSTLGDW